MSALNESGGERNTRRFIRLDLHEEVRALDSEGRDIGRVEKVGAGGMQVRLREGVATDHYQTGAHLEIGILEPDGVRNRFRVEVRMCAGGLLGLEFVS